MDGYRKESGFMEIIKDGFSYLSKIISASIFPPIAEGAQLVIKRVEKSLIRIEKRMLRKITSLMIILFGMMILVFSLFFFMIEFLSWNKPAALFAIGITVFAAGLMLKLAGYDK